MVEKTFVEWDQFLRDIDALYEKVKNEKFDLIICVNRSGLILGRILSDKMGLPLGVISFQSYKRGGQSIGKHVMHPAISLIGKTKGKVLLVDDLVDSGKTVEVLKNHIGSIEGVEDVKSAVIYNKRADEKSPDFFVQRTENWVVFPYEIEEFNEKDENAESLR